MPSGAAFPVAGNNWFGVSLLHKALTDKVIGDCFLFVNFRFFPVPEIGCRGSPVGIF